MEIPRFCHRPVFGEIPAVEKSIISKRDRKLHKILDTKSGLSDWLTAV
jgi:hypothetical protein